MDEMNLENMPTHPEQAGRNFNHALRYRREIKDGTILADLLAFTSTIKGLGRALAVMSSGK